MPLVREADGYTILLTVILNVASSKHMSIIQDTNGYTVILIVTPKCCHKHGGLQRKVASAYSFGKEAGELGVNFERS